MSTRSVAVAPGRKLAVQLESDDFGNEHRHRLAEHRRFGFDPADAPAEYAEPVDHRGVGVGADERVGIGERFVVLFASEHSLRQVLEIHLVADAGVGRHDAEVVQRLLSPAQKRVALLIALELEVGVDEERRLGSVFVHLHRVVDDEIDRLERIDLRRIAAELGERVAHRGEIDDRRDAGEILEQHARGAEGDLLLDLSANVPVRQRADVVGFDELAVFVAEEILEENLEAERQRIRIPIGEFSERIEPENRVLLAADV